MAYANFSTATFVEVHSSELCKNKRNWEECDETSESRKKQKVNITFVVEEVDNLYNGFIETVCDSNQASNTSSPLRVSNLSEQCTESVNIGPADTENTENSLLMGQRENEDLCDRKEQSEAKSLFTLNTTPAASCEIENYDFNQGDNVEYDVHMGYTEDSSEGFAVALDEDYLEEQKCVSVDSYSAFCREADLKPHCSELELSLNDSKQELDANSIAQMSSTELTKTIQKYAKALASLLRETKERTKLCPSVTDAAEAGDMHAEFLAGSFRNKDDSVNLQCGSSSS